MARARDIEAIAPDATFGEAAAGAVRTRAEEVFEFGHRVLNVDDIEAVHDMRVATRRLRAAMEVYAPAFPRKAFESALADVKALADDLGARRDPDVAIEQLRKIQAGMPPADHPGVEHLIESLGERQAKGNERLAARLASVGDDRLKERLDALAGMARTPKRGGGL
jgi:CHAD domain-containing protein